MERSCKAGIAACPLPWLYSQRQESLECGLTSVPYRLRGLSVLLYFPMREATLKSYVLGIAKSLKVIVKDMTLGMFKSLNFFAPQVVINDRELKQSSQHG